MEKISLTEFYNYKFLSQLKTQKDKEALVVSVVDEASNSYKSSIYLNKGNGFKKLTGLNKERNYIFLDENILLFPALRDDNDKKRAEKGYLETHFYTLDLNGGEAQKAFTLPFACKGYKKINDELLAVIALTDIEHFNAYLYDDKQKDEVIAQKQAESDYEVIEEIPWWHNGTSGYTLRTRSRLFVYNMKTNDLQPVTQDPYFDVYDLCVNENKVLYTGLSYKTKSEFKVYLFEYDLKTQETITLLDGTEFRDLSSMDYIEDKIYFFATKGEKYGMNENPYLYCLDPKTKEITLLNAFEDSIYSSVGSDCRYGGSQGIKYTKDGIYTIVTVRNASCLYKFDLDGTCHKLVTKEGSIDGLDVNSNIVTMICMHDGKLQEVYHLNLESNELTQVSSFNEEILKDKYVASFNKINFNSDTTDIDGWVLLPKDYDESKSYPCIFDIHGGPKTVYGEVFYHEMQYWANEGYFVCFANPTGSDGRGNAFADIRGKYGTQDYKDLMNFMDEVLKRYPAIDAKRVGVTGGSYGGFMTNWIIGHTDRFACAATQRSISNWFSMYGTCDIGYFFAQDQMASNIFTSEGQEKMWWHSPLKYAGNVVTPTLFIHSNEDYRCTLPEGMQLFTALCEKGVETRMCMFKGENHELSRGGKPLHRTRRLKEITQWMDAHCKGE